MGHGGTEHVQKPQDAQFLCVIVRRPVCRAMRPVALVLA